VPGELPGNILCIATEVEVPGLKSYNDNISVMEDFGYFAGVLNSSTNISLLWRHFVLFFSGIGVYFPT
jgi:hypothetical protein